MLQTRWLRAPGLVLGLVLGLALAPPPVGCVQHNASSSGNSIAQAGSGAGGAGGRQADEAVPHCEFYFKVVGGKLPDTARARLATWLNETASRLGEPAMVISPEDITISSPGDGRPTAVSFPERTEGDCAENSRLGRRIRDKQMLFSFVDADGVVRVWRVDPGSFKATKQYDTLLAASYTGAGSTTDAVSPGTIAASILLSLVIAAGLGFVIIRIQKPKELRSKLCKPSWPKKRAGNRGNQFDQDQFMLSGGAFEFDNTMTRNAKAQAAAALIPTTATAALG